jgi:hypothetical protein
MGGPVDVDALLSEPDCRSTGATPGKFSGLTPSPADWLSATPEFVAIRFIYSAVSFPFFLQIGWGSLSLIPSNLFSAFLYRLINPR